MSATNLAYLQTAVDVAVEHEIRTPRITDAARKAADKAKLRVVAGIIVPDQEAEEEVYSKALDARREKLKAFHGDRKVVRESLEKIGITPVAIVPKAAWEALCDRTGLYMLAPDENGRVWASRQPYWRIARFAERCVIPINLAMIAIVALLGSAIAGLLGANAVNVFISGVFSGLAMFVLEFVLAGFTQFQGWIEGLVGKYLINKFARQPHEQILQAFFPGRRIAQSGSYAYPKLRLPDPPADVQETLLRAKDLELQVAAVGDAISFTQTPAEILLEQHAAEEETRRQKWVLSIDPIVYHVHGEAVAVIAQYGEFPVEKEVIDEVVNSDYLV